MPHDANSQQGLVPLTNPLVIGDVVHWTENQFLRKRGWVAPKPLGALAFITRVEACSRDGLAVGLVVLACHPLWSAIPYKVGIYKEFPRSLIDLGRPMRVLWEDEYERDLALKDYLASLREVHSPRRPTTPRR